MSIIISSLKKSVHKCLNSAYKHGRYEKNLVKKSERHDKWPENME